MIDVHYSELFHCWVAGDGWAVKTFLTETQAQQWADEQETDEECR